MGFFGAIRSCYVNYLTFSGRARRKEYWYFFLFQFLVILVAQTAIVAWSFADPMLLLSLTEATQDPEKAQLWLADNTYLLWAFALSGLVYFVAFTIPNLSVTVRRLHDTDRRGWWILFPAAISAVSGGAGAALAVILPPFGPLTFTIGVVVVPLVSSLYLLILMCLPGTDRPNRFGPDPIDDDPRRDPVHPALAGARSPEDQRAFEAQRRAEIRQLYQTRVLGAKKV